MALAFVGLALGAFAFLTPFSLQSWLQHFGIPTQNIHFGDLDVIAQAIVARTNGVSPYEPSHPCGFIAAFNYPTIWLLWGYLGLHPSTLQIWGVLTGTLFVATAIIAVQPADRTEGIYLATLLCSPVCLLLIERANSDQVIFAALVGGVVCAQVGWLATVTVLLCAFGKLYPAAAIAGLLPGRNRYRWLGYTVIIVALLVVWLFFTWEEWRIVSRVTPRVPF